MTAFPDIIGDELALTPWVEVENAPMGENVYDRFRKWLRPRYVIELAFTQLAESDAQSIDDHVLGQSGSGVKFDWFFWTTFHWLWLPLGVGTGGAVVYTIPGKDTSDREFFHSAGTSISGPVTSGTGAQGEDQVTLTAPSGANVWCNFSGRRRFRVTYESDQQPLTRMADPGTYNFRTRLVQEK